jgi:hypothetical protein
MIIEHMMSPQYDQDDMMEMKDSNMLNSPDDKHRLLNTDGKDKEDGAAMEIDEEEGQADTEKSVSGIEVEKI